MLCKGARKSRGGVRVIDVFKRHGREVDASSRLTPEQGKALRNILACRTALLGGHKTTCKDCGHQELSYNSCRNRFCPGCHWQATERWIASRQQRILDVCHFHDVFTPAPQLRPFFLTNQALLYDLLLRSASKTLLEFGKTRDMQIGVIAVLHTWRKDLCFHPHVHCLATGGGLSLDGSKWVACKPTFQFPVHALSKKFRGKFLHHFKCLWKQGKLTIPNQLAHLEDDRAFQKFLDELYAEKWLTYAKPALKSAEHVIKYLGRYTHRIGISDSRLVSFDDQGVTFRVRHGKTISLDPHTFIRRYLTHVLPTEFRKIRNYGLFASANVNTKLKRAAELVGRAKPKEKTDEPTTPACRACRSINVATVEVPRMPYFTYLEVSGARAPPRQAAA